MPATGASRRGRPAPAGECRSLGSPPESIRYTHLVIIEWDPRKASSNIRKHRVSFIEASTVFDDPLSLTYPDPDHSVAQHRFLTFGHSSRSRLLVVSHTETADLIRIISARRASRREQHEFTEGI